MIEFTPFSSLIGGALIGLAAVMVMLFHGRIAGISGILGCFLPPWSNTDGLLWRAAFVLGLILAPIIYQEFLGIKIEHIVSNNLLTMISAGLIVGLGVGLGRGCTSGHGVCGIPRASVRSIIATITFMSFGILTVFIIRHVIGG